MLYTDIIDDRDRFLKLGREWSDLLAKSGQDHLCLTHQYLFTWWKHLARSASLRIILVHEDGELLAIAPLILRRGTLLNCPVRRIEFAGSGWGYGGFILSKKKRECLREIFLALEEMDNWDVIYLGQTLSDPEIAPKELIGLFPEKRSVHESIGLGIPYIPLHMTWEAYLAERSPNFRRNLRNRSKKLRELGKVDFRRITRIDESGNSLSKIMEWVRTIADRSWKAKEGTAISSDPPMFAFFTELVERLNEMGSLDVSILFVDERPVAYIFGAMYKGDYFEIDIAFDMAFSKVSPGIVARNYLLQELFQKRSGKYDFMAYFDYKKELTSFVQDSHVHVIYRRKLYPLALRWLRSTIRRKMGHLLKDYSDASWGLRHHEEQEA